MTRPHPKHRHDAPPGPLDVSFRLARGLLRAVAERLPVRDVVEKLPTEPPSFALATLLNQLLLPKLDPERRKELSGKCVEFHIKDAGVRVRLQLGPRGFAPAARGAHTVLKISAPAASFWKLAAGKEDADTLFFERALTMEGDTEFGLLVKNTLDAIGPLVPAFLRRH